MSEVKIRYSLFTKFEDALVQFHIALMSAKDYYKWIFDGLLNSQDMNKEVIDDTTFMKIQEQRFLLQEEQHRISRIISNDSSAFLTLSEINARIGDKFEKDIVSIGKECINLYAELTRYTSAIEKFYSTKANEYKSFFDSLYNVKDQKNDNYEIAAHGVSRKKNGLDKQGVLIQAKV